MDEDCLPTKEAVKQGHLVLNAACDYRLHRSIVAKLAIHQLEGVRFLSNQLQEYSGIFVNDESGLGKCYQVVALLSGTVVDERPSIILCPTRERTHHWLYHLDVLSPSLRSRVHPKSQLEVANELGVLSCTEWQYAIVDETRGFLTTQQLDRLRVLPAEKYIFLSSRDLLVDESMVLLSARLEYACGPAGAQAVRSIIDQARRKRTKTANFRVYLCTRRFILRRRARDHRQQLPLIGKPTFLESFRAWKVANEIEESEELAESAREPVFSVEYTVPTVRSQESSFLPIDPRTMTPEATGSDSLKVKSTGNFMSSAREDSRAQLGCPSPANVHMACATLHAAGSEPLFDLNETDTQQMPPLRVDSDTPSERGSGSIPEGGINIPETVTDSDGADGGGIYVPETAVSCSGSAGGLMGPVNSEDYIQFGQQISAGSTSTQPVLADDRYEFPQEKFLSRTSDSSLHPASESSLSGCESIPNAQPPVPLVTISSSDSPARVESPPLFEEDTDNDTLSMRSDGDDLLHDLSTSNGSPGRVSASPKTVPLARRQPSVSTPIAKLMYGTIADGTLQREMNVSSYDIFSDSPIAVCAPRGAAPAEDNVFEITKNVAFPNRIVVGEGDIPTVRVVDDSSDDDDDDDVQFVDATMVGVIDVDDPSTGGTPKSNAWSTALSMQRTPPSSGGSNFAGSSPGRGWFGKGVRASSVSPRSSASTPTTSKPTTTSPRGIIARSGSAASTSTRVAGVPILRNPSRRRRLEDLFKDTDDNSSSGRVKRSRNEKSDCHAANNRR